MSLFITFHLLTFLIMTILTIEEFNEFAEAYPELANCVCLDEVVISLNDYVNEYEEVI
jgi:hypothetical protein